MRKDLGRIPLGVVVGVPNRGIRRLGALASCLLGTVLPAALTFASDVPFTGAITQKQVPIRAGAGEKSFYVVGRLQENDLVQVEEMVYGWYKIAPPKNTFSYIEKSLVDLSADGRSGRVNRDRTPVKAANADPNAQPEDSWRTQISLNTDDRVQVVGEVGDRLKIVPPPGAFVWVEPGVVRRLSKEEAEAAMAAVPPAPGKPPRLNKPAETENLTRVVEEAAPAPETTGIAPTAEVATTTQAPPATQPAEQPDTVESAAPSPEEVSAGEKPELEVVILKPTASELIKLEQRLTEITRQPLEKQPLAELLSGYQALAEGAELSSTDRSLVESRLTELQRRQKAQAALAQVTEALKPPPPPPSPAATQPPSYQAVGQLLASTIYDGQSLPLLYRLVDPSSLRTIAYISPGQAIEPSKCLGRVVGVVGEPGIDAGLRVRVISAQRIDVLESAAP